MSRTKSATNSSCSIVSRPDQGGLRGEVGRGLPAGHGDLRLQVAEPMQQDQPKQGFALAAVEGAAVVAVDQRVDARRIACGEGAQRAQRMRFEGGNGTARRPMMRAGGRELHNGWRASSLLEELSSHPPTMLVGPAINGLPTAPQVLYPSERAAAKLQARLVFGRWFGVVRW